MDTDWLDDGSLPLFTASIRQCASMLALENPPPGTAMDSPEVEALWDAPPHSLGELEFPCGPMSRAREDVEKAMCRDVDLGRLATSRLRRDLDGSIKVAETVVDIDDLQAWASMYGLQLGDTLAAYSDGEAGLANDALDAISVGRALLADRDKVREARKRALAMTEDEVAAMFLENLRLKSRQLPAPEDRLHPKERTSLLRIIRALDKIAELKKRGGSTSIAAQLELDGFRGPTDDTIRKVIEAARGLEP